MLEGFVLRKVSHNVCMHTSTLSFRVYYYFNNTWVLSIYLSLLIHMAAKHCAFSLPLQPVVFIQDSHKFYPGFTISIEFTLKKVWILGENCVNFVLINRPCNLLRKQSSPKTLLPVIWATRRIKPHRNPVDMSDLWRLGGWWHCRG